MKAKTSVFDICVEAVMYLLLYNLHDCTFNYRAFFSRLKYKNICIAEFIDTCSFTKYFQLLCNTPVSVFMVLTIFSF